jgi:tetratricopeptide (TPR) repeat protein
MEAQMTANSDTTIKDTFSAAMTEFAAGNLGRSIEMLTDVLNHDPDNKLALTARGSAHLKLDDPSTAAEDFSRALALDPEYARAYHLRGLAREKAGDADGALEDIDRAVDLNPEYGAAYYSRATLLTQMGREDAATEDIQMVTHLTNRNMEAFAAENNVWRSQQMRLEGMLETELER